MKKLLLVLLSLMMFLGVMAACDIPENPEPEQPQTPSTLEMAEEAYKKISEAKKIEQNIEIKAGTLLRFGKQKTYTKNGGEYAVKETVKRLNDLSAEDPYSPEEKEYTISAATTPAAALDLDEEYFSSSDIKDGVFTLSVKAGSESSVFSIEEELPAPVYGMEVKITAEEQYITKLEISYASGSSNVKIELLYTY